MYDNEVFDDDMYNNNEVSDDDMYSNSMSDKSDNNNHNDNIPPLEARKTYPLDYDSGDDENNNNNNNNHSDTYCEHEYFIDKQTLILCVMIIMKLRVMMIHITSGVMIVIAIQMMAIK